MNSRAGHDNALQAAGSVAGKETNVSESSLVSRLRVPPGVDVPTTPVGRIERELRLEAADEIDRLTAERDKVKAVLCLFGDVVSGVPDNWPGACRLRVDTRSDGSEYLAYHGEPEERLGVLPKISEWREAAKG